MRVNRWTRSAVFTLTIVFVGAVAVYATTPMVKDALSATCDHSVSGTQQGLKAQPDTSAIAMGQCKEGASSYSSEAQPPVAGCNPHNCPPVNSNGCPRISCAPTCCYQCPGSPFIQCI